MRIALLADIGQPVYHVGDEAIGHAVADAVAARGHEPVLLTRNEAHTRHHFGDVRTIPTVAFPWPPVERERRLADLRAALASSDPLASMRAIGFGELADGLISCDAVHIAGGGNLNSTYGWLLSERVAVALIARALGKPVSLGGQTIGPALTGHDAADLADAFGSARSVGVRDAGSVTRARGFLAGTPASDLTVGMLDDATFLSAVSPAVRFDEGGSKPSEIEPAPEGLVVTLSGDALAPFVDRAEAVTAWAGLLDAVADETGLTVTFVPHMATPGEGDGDEEVHRLVAEAMRTDRIELLEIGDARSARQAVSRAALVISSRFHPIVFALAQGRPAVGVCATGYAFARVQGVFENWGMSGFALPIDAVLDPSAVSGLVALVGNTGVTDHLASVAPSRRSSADTWWDHLVSSLEGERAMAPAPALAPAVTLEAPIALLSLARRLRLFARRAQSSESMWVDLDRAANEATALAAELEALRGSRTFRVLSQLRRIVRRGDG